MEKIYLNLKLKCLLPIEVSKVADIMFQMDINAGRGLGDLSPVWIVENIFTKPCVHCGETDWHKIGCNRLDNSKPHTMDNVEPCCYECNVKLAGAERTQKKNSN